MDSRGTITGIRLKNYKAFKDTGWIDFNNFTLLYGYNSNGKSTILKFLYQLKRCISSYRIGMNVALWGDEFDDAEGGFLELLYNGQEKKTSEMSLSFKMTLCEEDDLFVRTILKELTPSMGELLEEFIVYTISYKYDQKGKKVDLRSFSIQYGEYTIYRYTTTHTGSYRVETDIEHFAWNSSNRLPAYFNICNGVILEDKVASTYMNGMEVEHDDWYGAARKQRATTLIQRVKAVINEILINYTDDFEYFYPSRSVPKRVMKLSLDNSRRVGALGENTYDVLYAIETNKEADKKKGINEYLNIFGYSYEWRISKNGYGEFLLVDLKTKAKVNILDCGFGISQILPIIVSCFDDSKEALAVDSPDAHLHSKVHGAICDLLIDTAKRRNVIIETHSENMLLRLQRRIVEKNEIYPDMATIYFITDTGDGTVCKKITFNEYGDLVNEPAEFKQFFSASFEDVMSIAKAKGERMIEKNANSD